MGKHRSAAVQLQFSINNMHYPILLSILIGTSFAASSRHGRITGGTRAARGQFPNTGWVADLDYKFVASCWIYNEKWIVSTAFGQERTPENTKLIFGTASLLFDEKDKIYNHTVTNIVNHPEFNPKTLENNIGLIQTKERIYFTLYVQAFAPFTEPIHPDMIATVVGFGQNYVS